MMEFLHLFETFSSSALTALANSILPSILLVLVIQIFLLIQTGRNAATRYGLWFGAMLFVLLLPVIISFVDLSKNSNGATSSDPTHASSFSEEPDPSLRAPITAPIEFSAGVYHLEVVEKPLTSQSAALSSNTQSDQSESFVLWLPADLGSYAFSAWIVGSLFLLIRLGRSYRHMQLLKTSSLPLENSRLLSLLSDPFIIGKQRSITIGVCSDIDSPAAVGLFKPMILIPEAFLTRFSEEELCQIVYHESAHLKRCDDWTKLSQEFVQAVLFFNPVVWWIGHNLDLNRELACDDYVMAETNNDWTSYSECLLKVLEAVKLKNNAPARASLMMAKSRIESRIKRLVSQQKVPSTTISIVGLVPLFVIFFGVLLFGNPLAIQIEMPDERLLSSSQEEEPDVLQSLSGVTITNLKSSAEHNVFLLPASLRVPMHAIESFRFDEGRTALIGATFEIIIENQNVEFDVDDAHLIIEINRIESHVVMRAEDFVSTGFSNIRTTNSSDEVISSAWIATDAEALDRGQITQLASMGLVVNSEFGLTIQTKELLHENGTKRYKAYLTPILDNQNGGEGGGIE